MVKRVDIVKDTVAERVQRLVCDTNWNIILRSVEDYENEAHIVTKLITVIRIRTAFGPRYFKVQVKEEY